MTTETSSPSRTESLLFAGLRIDFDDRVLRPRPWTELQSRWAAELAARHPGARILELCSGAGHIGLAAAALADRDAVCVDVDPDAASRTASNARANGLGDRVEVRAASIAAALCDRERFAVVTADPPWVVSSATTDFPEDPLLAIDGGPDGLDVARECVTAVRDHLPPGGSLLVQLGSAAQADVLARGAAREGWQRGETRTGEGGVVLELLHP